MTTAFHARPYGRFIEIKKNFGRKKFDRTSQGSNFLESSFSNRDNSRAPIQFRRERQSQHLQSWFSSRAEPPIFTSIGQELL